MSETDQSRRPFSFAALVISTACLVGIVWIAVLFWPAQDLFATPGATADAQAHPTAASPSAPRRHEAHRRVL
jgi:hypothetical protein